MWGHEAHDVDDRRTLLRAIQHKVDERLEAATGRDWGNARVAERPWWYFGLRTDAIIRIGNQATGAELDKAFSNDVIVTLYVSRARKLYRTMLAEHGYVPPQKYPLRRSTPAQLRAVLAKLSEAPEVDSY